MIGQKMLVVLYLSSTSNHNGSNLLGGIMNVVLYLSSTSNHNNPNLVYGSGALCYIFLLHQTTTARTSLEAS